MAKTSPFARLRRQLRRRTEELAAGTPHRSAMPSGPSSGEAVAARSRATHEAIPGDPRRTGAVCESG